MGPVFYVKTTLDAPNKRIIAIDTRAPEPAHWRTVVPESADTIDVTTATLDYPDAFAPTRHVWLEHKIAWENVDSALPQYREGSGEAARTGAQP